MYGLCLQTWKYVSELIPIKNFMSDNGHSLQFPVL